MKNKILSLLAVLLLATACGSATTEVQKGEETLITVGETEITKANVYTMIAADGNSNIIQKKMYEILIAKYLKEDDATIKAAEEKLAAQKETYGDEWDNTLKANGYDDEEAFFQDLLYGLNVERLTDLYIKDNFKDLNEKYKMRKVEIVSITDAEKTEAALKDAENDVEFSEIATTYGDASTYTGNASVYNSKSGLPEIVWSNILDVEKDNTLIKKVIQDTTTSTYYLVKVKNVKASDFKEEAITSLKSITATSDTTAASTAELAMGDQAFAYYLKDSGYSIHDVNIYQLLLTSSQKFARD